MKENQRNTCRNLIVPPNSPESSSPPLSYFLSITFADQPKIRIKIPKMFIKTLRRRRSRSSTNNNNNNNNNNERANIRKVFPKKVSFNFCKYHKTSHEFHRNLADKKEAKEAENLKKIGFCDMGSVQKPRYVTESILQKKRLESLGNKIRLPFKTLFSAKNIDSSSALMMANYKVRLSFKRLFGKKNVNDVESSSGLSRVSWGMMMPRKKLKMVTLMRKKKKTTSKLQSGGEEDGEREQRLDKELCKKRILMGEKCRPLNHSGNLQYDKDGVLLPEDLPW